jgi:glycosyltransferase involved in cell wall biosynthesis
MFLRHNLYMANYVRAGADRVKVSVIVTVFNEEASIQRLLNSLAQQTRRPDEVIVCDGGSSDQTLPLLQRHQEQQTAGLLNLQVLSAPGANISQGRNYAIQAAAGPIIAVTDAGVRLDQRWLERLIAPWERASADCAPEQPAAVAGFFLPDPDADDVFATAMAATVLPLHADIDPHKFLPSSRSVAFRKTAWQAVGGYPEWLDYCEDLVFDFKLKAYNHGQPFVWAPDALVYFRPRQNLRSFWQQYYRYARGDGKAHLWRKRHAIRYATYFVALPTLLGHAFGGSYARWLGWVGLLCGVAVYCLRPWQRVWQLGTTLSSGQKLQAALLVPLIRLVGDLAKMAGYPIGCWQRWKNKNLRT